MGLQSSYLNYLYVALLNDVSFVALNFENFEFVEFLCSLVIRLIGWMKSSLFDKQKIILLEFLVYYIEKYNFLNIRIICFLFLPTISSFNYQNEK